MSEFFRDLPLILFPLLYSTSSLCVIVSTCMVFFVIQGWVTPQLVPLGSNSLIHLRSSTSWSSPHTGTSESIAIKPGVLASDLPTQLPTGSCPWESIASWESSSTRLSAFHLFLHIWVGSTPVYLRIWAGKLGASFNLSLFPPHESSHPFGSTF